MIPPYYPDHPVTREDWAKYLDAATELDRKIGLILKQLEADGLADSTVVVFTGDTARPTSAASNSATTAACACR